MKYFVTFEVTYVVEHDLGRTTPEWRRSFYDYVETPEDIAAHFAYNDLTNQIEPHELDGFADLEPGSVKVRCMEIETIEAYADE